MCPIALLFLLPGAVLVLEVPALTGRAARPTLGKRIANVGLPFRVAVAGGDLAIQIGSIGVLVRDQLASRVALRQRHKILITHFNQAIARQTDRAGVVVLLQARVTLFHRRDQLPDMIANLALAFIRSSKDRRLTPEKLRALLDRQPAPLPLAELGLEIYADYQRALTYRAAVDFDDLIRLALDILEMDEEYLERVRYRFPYILEDEAQDSSQLQQNILSLLSGSGGNWVRVGDPNQAIFETFTTAGMISPAFSTTTVSPMRTSLRWISSSL